MNDRDILRHERLDRVSTFGIENHADLPAGSEAIARFANVATLSGKLDGFKVGQLRGPASLQTLLDAAWSDFKDIARTARAIDLDEPGFAAFYRLPGEPTASNIKTHADSLLARLEDAPADTPAQLAEKAALRAKFIGKLIPADFVEDLRADRDAIDGKNLANTAGNLKGLESTESISVLLLEGTQEVTRLDAMMQNLYRRNPAKLHAWLAASRVERSPKRKKDDGDAAGGTTPAN
ncbi:MAG: hypothetical protein V4584_17790 [Verrucomicrobiota bacterium]